MPVVCLAKPLQVVTHFTFAMSSVPLPEAAQLQKPQDYKETFKVSLYARLAVQNVFNKYPEAHSRFGVCGSMQTSRVGIFQVLRAVSLVFETPLIAPPVV